MGHKALNRLIVGLIIAVLMAVSWLLGQRHGASQTAAVAATKLSSVEAQSLIDQLQKTVQAHRVELEVAESLAKTNAARARTLADQLEVQMRASLSDANDLALYRQIERGENPRSLDVATLGWSPLRPSQLDLTLVQWQGRDRIAGQVQVSLEYAQATETRADTVILDPLSFDFRFFQSLAVPMATDSGNDFARNGKTDASNKGGQDLPERVIVQITPRDSRLRPVTKAISWNDIAE